MTGYSREEAHENLRINVVRLDFQEKHETQLIAVDQRDSVVAACLSLNGADG